MDNSLTPFSPAVDMLKALRQGQISSVELLDLHLQQIEQTNPALNAIAIPNYEAARQEAQQADTRRSAGDDAPLLGLPITVKDWLEVGGMRSTAGDPNFAATNYTAKADGLVVERLRRAGAVVFAKTNMAPWGGDWRTDNPVFGRTNNPWDLERTPGGSTGGGAAAVAAGLSPLEIGNDIGGSVRIPPAFCGIFGHKTSETAWPRSGQGPDRSGLHLPNPVSGLAVMGPLARSAADIALALDVASGPDLGEDAAWQLRLPPARHTRLEDFRVAVLPPISWLPVDDSILAAQDHLAGELRRLGAVVGEAQPEGFDTLWPLFRLYHKLSIVVTSLSIPKETRREIAQWARLEAEQRQDDLFLAGAEAFEADTADYIRWFAERERLRHAFRQFFKDWDILLAPVAMSNAFRHDEVATDVDIDDLRLSINGEPVPYRYLVVYPAIATLCGQPATVFPAGLSPSGLPVGLQAIGPYLEDHTSIQFAACASEIFGGYRPPNLT